MKLKGPMKFVKKYNIIREIKYLQILEACLELSNHKYNLIENNFYLKRLNGIGKIYIYHTYTYLDNQVKKSGRWYAFFDELRLNENEFEHQIDNYEIEDDDNFGTYIAKIKIKFSNNIISKIMNNSV